MPSRVPFAQQDFIVRAEWSIDMTGESRAGFLQIAHERNFINHIVTRTNWEFLRRSGGQVLLSLLCLLAWAQTCRATDFTCSGGDMACLIQAIHTANGNGQTNTIHLEAGTYTLTAIDNGTNGLPVIESRLTLVGAGSETTSIERDVSAPTFRILMVGAAGNLTLMGLTLRGGENIEGGGGIFNGGTLTITGRVPAPCG
jgi:hypothetical protein